MIPDGSRRIHFIFTFSLSKLLNVLKFTLKIIIYQFIWFTAKITTILITILTVSARQQRNAHLSFKILCVSSASSGLSANPRERLPQKLCSVKKNTKKKQLAPQLAFSKREHFRRPKPAVNAPCTTVSPRTTVRERTPARTGQKLA